MTGKVFKILSKLVFRVHILDWKMPPPHTLTVKESNAGRQEAWHKADATWIKWLKTANASSLHSYFANHIKKIKELPDQPGESSCGGGGDEWYSFVAFK